jgi:hypothetical protein
VDSSWTSHYHRLPARTPFSQDEQRILTVGERDPKASVVWLRATGSVRHSQYLLLYHLDSVSKLLVQFSKYDLRPTFDDTRELFEARTTSNYFASSWANAAVHGSASNGRHVLHSHIVRKSTFTRSPTLSSTELSTTSCTESSTLAMVKTSA